MKIAMIGFGEAAQAMALGFQEEGSLSGLFAYDIRTEDPTHGIAIRTKAEELGVQLSSSATDAVSKSEIVLSMVQGAAATNVARIAAPTLSEEQIFIDLNSISPDAKRQVAAVIECEMPSACVEGAILDAVKPRRHKVPILLAGPRAGEAADRLNEVGMRCEAIGVEIGQACSVKMVRSVMIKGTEALIIEAMRAAERAGVTERILDSLNGTFPGLDWRKLTSHYLKRTHEHGGRRVSEMKEAAATLEGLNLEPLMCTAIVETIGSGHAALAVKPYNPDASYPDLLKVLAQ